MTRKNDKQPAKGGVRSDRNTGGRRRYSISWDAGRARCKDRRARPGIGIECDGNVHRTLRSIKSWRDLRNRYRVQFGIALLSVPELSVAAIAGDVGYGSAAAFARALANLGLPPPGELREEIARLAQVE